jgi:hypothetical protein
MKKFSVPGCGSEIYSSGKILVYEVSSGRAWVLKFMSVPFGPSQAKNYFAPAFLLPVFIANNIFVIALCVKM